ncbi:hypothetical protein AB0L99_44405 [Streptomyces sp. NPDC051954]|uniref:hypothetical protein n=1 Tax=unclassified Streptomyces TaxID=2593676 RepID=UPI003446DCCB
MIMVDERLNPRLARPPVAGTAIDAGSTFVPQLGRYSGEVVAPSSRAVGPAVDPDSLARAGWGQSEIDGHLWLVEFRFFDKAHRLVAHFYIVEDAEDQDSAQRIAEQRAASAPEQEARGWIGLGDCCSHVHSLRRTAIGRWYLSAADGEGPAPDDPRLVSRTCELARN